MSKKNEGAGQSPVFISFRLEGEPAAKFLKVKQAKHLKLNAELARSLMLPALDEELKKIKSAKPPKAA